MQLCASKGTVRATLNISSDVHHPWQIGLINDGESTLDQGLSRTPLTGGGGGGGRIMSTSHYIQKSHCGHVLWPILAIKFDGYVSLVV